jgi:BlaI family transcriptional regulator, penicillinase repressor
VTYSQPTRPELTILKLLWKQSQLSAREVHQQISGDLKWSYSTTRTTLERMCDKGLLGKRAVHGMTVYAPAVEKVALLGGLIRDFTKRVLEVEGPLPAAMFARSKLLSEDDLSALEAMLEDLDKEEGAS